MTPTSMAVYLVIAVIGLIVILRDMKKNPPRLLPLPWTILVVIVVYLLLNLVATKQR